VEHDPSITFDQYLDARGETCPMPLLKAKRCLNAMVAGQCLKVEASDAGSQRDFSAFARLAGHGLVAAQVGASHFIYYLTKA
jgi:TusA-related sulfurtransferase